MEVLEEDFGSCSKEDSHRGSCNHTELKDKTLQTTKPTQKTEKETSTIRIRREKKVVWS